MPSKLPSGSTNVGLSRARGGSSDKLREGIQVLLLVVVLLLLFSGGGAYYW